MNFIRPLARIALCNVPIRTSPTNVPPYGMLYIRQALLKIGCEVDFYNFDFRRFSDQEILELFSKKKYDFVGISAVVSTSYFFVKKVSQAIKESFPETYT